MFIHDLASMKVPMIEMNHATSFLPERTTGHERHPKPKIHNSRTGFDDLFLIRDLGISTVFHLPHILHPGYPAFIHEVNITVS